MSRSAGASAPERTELVAVSRLLRSAVVDPAGERLGQLQDIIVRLGESGGYPPVTGLKIGVGGRDLFVGADQVATLAPGEVRLSGQTLNLGRFERRPGEVLVRQDIVGHHLVDVAAGRIVQAQDLALSRSGGRWRLAGVLRRKAGGFSRLLPGRSEAATGDVLDWRDVHPFVGHVPTAKLTLSSLRLRRLHPAQIADLVENSTHEEGEEIIQAVESDAELTADVFEELDTKHQLEFLRSETDPEAAAILARMSPDDAADLLLALDQDRRLSVLNAMPSRQQVRVRALLQYNPTTAGGMMSPDYVAVPAGTTVAAALDQVRAQRDLPAPVVTVVFVVSEGGHLAGSIPVVDLLRSEPGAAVETLEELVTPCVDVGDDIAEVALKMSDYNLTALPVIDADANLVGTISVDDLLEVVMPREWRRRESN